MGNDERRAAAADLVIVCGLPGTGKATHARRVAADRRAIRLCPDEWMEALRIGLWESDARDWIESLQWQLAQDLLRVGTSVVIEWGTWARSERDRLRAGARAIGARVELHYLDVPLDELVRRVAARGREEPQITRSHLEQ